LPKVFLRFLASGRGSFVETASVVPVGFEVAVVIVDSSRMAWWEVSGRCSSVELFLQQFLCVFGTVGGLCCHTFDAITLDVE